MKIAMVDRTHANLAFVTVDQIRNALSEPINVQLDNANVAVMMSVCTQKRAPLGSVKVSNPQCSIFILSPLFNLRSNTVEKHEIHLAHFNRML